MYYYVYMIRSITPGTTKSYVGYTNNLELRLTKHNNNKGAKSTRGYNWVLIYSKKIKSKNEAMSYEYKLKKNKTLRKKLLEKSL